MPRRALLTLGFFACLCSFLGPTAAHAHGKSVSYSSWHMTPEGAQVSVRIPLLDLSRLGIPLPLPGQGDTRAAQQAVGRYLGQRLDLTTAEGPCVPIADPSPRPAQEGWVRFRWSLRCEPGEERALESRILLDAAPSHLHFARVTLGEGSDASPTRIVERVLTEAQPSWTLNLNEASLKGGRTDAPADSFGRYLELGVEHILSGWDHLAFVFALILLARSLGEVARLVTGFTVAHSITLGLAVLGWVRVSSAPVEALIGFSVALIALENGWTLAGRDRWVPRLTVFGLLAMAALAGLGFVSLPGISLLGLALFAAAHFEMLRRAPSANLHRVALAFAFGLIHGFGFAGVLAEMQLPTDRLATALLGFNLGVEGGQLAGGALIWPALVLRRRPAGGRPSRLFAEVASAAICAVGVYWFLARALT